MFVLAVAASAVTAVITMLDSSAASETGPLGSPIVMVDVERVVIVVVLVNGVTEAVESELGTVDSVQVVSELTEGTGETVSTIVAKTVSGVVVCMLKCNVIVVASVIVVIGVIVVVSVLV